MKNELLKLSPEFEKYQYSNDIILDLYHFMKFDLIKLIIEKYPSFLMINKINHLSYWATIDSNIDIINAILESPFLKNHSYKAIYIAACRIGNDKLVNRVYPYITQLINYPFYIYSGLKSSCDSVNKLSLNTIDKLTDLCSETYLDFLYEKACKSGNHRLVIYLVLKYPNVRLYQKKNIIFYVNLKIKKLIVKLENVKSSEKKLIYKSKLKKYDKILSYLINKEYLPDTILFIDINYLNKNKLTKSCLMHG